MTERQIAVAKLTEQASHGDDQLRQHDKWQQELTVQEQALAQRRRDLRRRQEEAARLLTELSKNITLKEADTVRCDQAKEAFYQTRNESLKQSQDLDGVVDDLRRRHQDWQQRCNAADIQREKYKSDNQPSRRTAGHAGPEPPGSHGAPPRRLAERAPRQGRLPERQITALGTINPAAEDEYKTLWKSGTSTTASAMT